MYLTIVGRKKIISVAFWLEVEPNLHVFHNQKGKNIFMVITTDKEKFQFRYFWNYFFEAVSYIDVIFILKKIVYYWFHLRKSF